MKRSDLIYILHSWRLTRTAQTKEQAYWNKASICLFSGRREAGGEILQEGRALFSPLGRNQEYFYFTVYSTCPFFFNEKFSFLFLALSRSASMALKSHTSSGDANSPLCLVLTQLLNKIPALAISLWKQKYRNKIS